MAGYFSITVNDFYRVLHQEKHRIDFFSSGEIRWIVAEVGQCFVEMSAAPNAESRSDALSLPISSFISSTLAPAAARGVFLDKKFSHTEILDLKSRASEWMDVKHPGEIFWLNMYKGQGNAGRGLLRVIEAFKVDDDWFFVRVKLSDFGNHFWRCDQISGLTALIRHCKSSEDYLLSSM